MPTAHMRAWRCQPSRSRLALDRRSGDRRRAAALFAAVDGITVQALAMPAVMTPARQRAALRLHVAALLGS